VDSTGGGLTRGAWIGLSTGLLLAIAAHRPRALVLIPLAAALSFFTLPQTVLKRAASTVNIQQPATRERLDMFASGLDMVHDHPILGVGPGQVQPAYAVHRADDSPPRIPHLHNNVIQIAAERGFAGLLCYFAILGSAVLHLFRAMRTSPPTSRPVIVGCLMAVVGVTAAGFFEYNWGDAEVWIVTLMSLSAPFALSPSRPI
jgi:O-antigen ligase